MGTENEFLAVKSTGRPIGVDREAGVLRGFVMAQAGRFKSIDGEFDSKSLRQIARLARRPPRGLKMRFAHPGLSNDGIGKFLGRARDPFIGTAVTPEGEVVEAVRADAHLSDSAANSPAGDLRSYILDLAEEDPDALSSSLVLQAEQEFRLNRDGTQKVDEDGNPLPPLWRPTALHASDIVDTGQAVDGLLAASLSADGLPDEVVREGADLIRRQFSGKPRAFVAEHLSMFVGRILDWYWPEEASTEEEVEKCEVEIEGYRLS